MGTTTAFLNLFLAPLPVLRHPSSSCRRVFLQSLKILAPAIDHTTRTNNGEEEGLTTSTNTPGEERNIPPWINVFQVVKHRIRTNKSTALWPLHTNRSGEAGLVKVLKVQLHPRFVSETGGLREV